ncbi:MAG: TRAP transporter TatT component family protein [Myxococcota bacterium]|nr:TRAP transporter TatT component family protein [Myxococcota bacterium]
MTLAISSSLRLGALLGLLLGPAGCSIRTYALRATADALSGTGGGYAEEGDPQLAREAAPFGLKTMEQILQQVPGHIGLHLALARGFTQYAYAFVHQDADRAEDRSLQAAQAGWLRARRLYLRGRDHALAGLGLRCPGISEALRSGDATRRDAALACVTKKDVPLLYWAGAAWALAVSTARDQPDLLGDLPTVEAMMRRALALDESYDEGALHEFFVAYEASRPGVDGSAAARKHLERALQLSGGHRLGPLLSYAEGVLVQQQNKKEFVALLQRVLAADVLRDDPAWRRNRLANLIHQDRARWLLGRLELLFAE